MMVYLESIRYSPRAALRNVVAGQQVPMELTSLGRAYLAGIAEAERERLLRLFRRRSAAATKALLADVRRSISAVERDGYCGIVAACRSCRRNAHRAGGTCRSTHST